MMFLAERLNVGMSLRHVVTMRRVDIIEVLARA